MAQPPLGSRLDPTPGAVRHQSSDDQITARRVMKTLAACLFRNNSRVAAEILAQPFGSAEKTAVIQRRVAGVHDCMGESGLTMGFDARALAGALSEVGLEARYATADLGRVTRLTADQITIFALAPRNGFEDHGLCVARRAPEAVRAWALSAPGSEAETAARRVVPPQVGPCVDQGQPLRADVVGLRAILSAGLYRALWLSR
jgi:hypothetical protein